MTLDLADVIEAEREERWLASLTRPARAVYHELLAIRDPRGYVEAPAARAAVRSALEAYYAAIDHRVGLIAGGVAVGEPVLPAVEAAAKAKAQQVAGTVRVLTELDERGHIRVGVVEGSPWRVWTADEAEEAEEVFG